MKAIVYDLNSLVLEVHENRLVERPKKAKNTEK